MSALEETIASAQHIVVAASFLFASEVVEHALLSAAERGVRVYLLTASEERLAKVAGNQFDKDRLREHRKLLNRLAGRVLVRSAPGFHAKALLVDPTTNPAGFLLTANLDDRALTKRQELGIRLAADEVTGVFRVLRWAFWEAARHELLQRNEMRAVNAAGIVAAEHGTAPVVSETRSDRSLVEAGLALLAEAPERVVVSGFGWDEDHPVVKGLVRLRRQGSDVTVLGRHTARIPPALENLSAAGVTVLGSSDLHAKAIWASDGRAVVQTANFETFDDPSRVDLGLVLDGARAAEVGQVMTAWCDRAPFTLGRETSAPGPSNQTGTIGTGSRT